MSNKGLLYAGINEIETISGKRISLINTDPESITIRDIAHGLSMTCRWGGQIDTFYSVAQHSVMVHNLVSDEYKLAALLHDASEGLGMGDVPSPFKSLMPDFKSLEVNLMTVIATKFGFNYPLDKQIKEADTEMLEQEGAWFRHGASRPGMWPPVMARDMFLYAYERCRK